MTSPELAGRWYDELLRPAFLDDELPPRDAMVSGIVDGSILAHVLGDPSNPDALGVGRFHQPSGVLLLEFLAVRPGHRGGGLGARALEAAISTWQEDLTPSMVVGEIEHPWLREADDALGDPVARLRFYHRAGVRVLPVAYVLPPMRDGGPAVPHLMLGVFRVDGRLPGAAVPAAPLRSWLADRFPHPHEPYAQALSDVAVAELPTIPLDAPVEDLPNAPRRDAVRKQGRPGGDA